MMQTAKQQGTAKNRSNHYADAPGKPLAIEIIPAPLAMLLFPELKHRSGNTSHGRQDAPTVRAPAPNPVLIPESCSRSDR